MLQVPKGNLEELVLLLSRVRAKIAVAAINESIIDTALSEVSSRAYIELQCCNLYCGRDNAPSKSFQQRIIEPLGQSSFTPTMVIYVSVMRETTEFARKTPFLLQAIYCGFIHKYG